MPSVEGLVKEKYGDVVALTDMDDAREALRHIAVDAGLGIALLTAWQHGLTIGHIPLQRIDGKAEAEQAYTIPADGDCPYVFVHVPIRRIRSDKPALIERGIMNRNADPAGFVYHEDGLIGTFSFTDPARVRLSKEDIAEILETLARQGILRRANIESRQIQFKDLTVKKRIEESRSPVYVRVEDQPLERGRLPVAFHREDVWRYLGATLKKRTACNYCSVAVLNPHEATIQSDPVSSQGARHLAGRATVRNYQMGFTYAPFGDPRTVCHFVAWDFPRIDELVMSMEPQAYSFSDLIKLTWRINRDIDEFYRDKADPPPPVSGICNHWGGNSIYHQHYQFLRIADLPLVRATTNPDPLATYRDVQVRRFDTWPAPAYLITTDGKGRESDLLWVADRVAREWQLLSEGPDPSYCNGISIKNHTQNIFATVEGDRLEAIFIPRDRRRVDTTRQDNLIQKRNAGALEMMGYFLIDDPDDFKKLNDGKARKDLKALGDSWLSDLAPPTPDTIREFENNIAGPGSR